MRNKIKKIGRGRTKIVPWKITGLILVAVFLLFGFFIFQRFNIERVFAQGDLIWVKTSSPSGGNDGVEGITSDNSYIYVIGSDAAGEGGQWRIEKRQKSDGILVWATTSDPSSGYDRPRSIASDDSYIYAVGFDNSPGTRQWRIEKRQKSDGSLVWAQTHDPLSALYGEAEDITLDDTYLYVAGYDLSFGNPQWRIEKRQKSDGSLVWAQTNNPSSGYDDIYSITTDETSLYIAGYGSFPFNPQWRIEKRQKSDGSLVWATTSDPSSGYDVATALVSDDAYLYIVGGDELPNNYQWRIEKRQKSDGSLVWAQTNNPSSDYDIANSITIDSAYIYIGGIDSVLGHYQWRIEKRGKISSIGHIRVWNGSKIIELNVIPVAGALAALKGVIKVVLPGGVVGAADLVETSDTTASPVRVRTPYGTKSWRKMF